MRFGGDDTHASIEEINEYGWKVGNKRKKNKTEHMQLNKPELRNNLTDVQKIIVSAIEEGNADLL